jgi:hypothetical protein
MELVNKITIKGLVGAVKAFIKNKVNGEVVKLVQIVGICNGSGVTPTQFGDSTFLKGQFKATSLIDGKIVQGSGKCYLPDSATNLILGQLTDEVKAVQFAFNIGVKVDESVQIGYVYSIEPLLKPEANNPIALLEQKLS